MTLPTRTRTTARTFRAEHIRWMRHQLCESTREFGKRWGVSHRTVESWEQGTRHPNRWIIPRMLSLYRALEALVQAVQYHEVA